MADMRLVRPRASDEVIEQLQLEDPTETRRRSRDQSIQAQMREQAKAALLGLPPQRGGGSGGGTVNAQTLTSDILTGLLQGGMPGPAIANLQAAGRGLIGKVGYDDALRYAGGGAGAGSGAGSSGAAARRAFGQGMSVGGRGRGGRMSAGAGGQAIRKSRAKQEGRHEALFQQGLQSKSRKEEAALERLNAAFASQLKRQERDDMLNMLRTSIKLGDLPTESTTIEETLANVAGAPRAIPLKTTKTLSVLDLLNSLGGFF